MLITVTWLLTFIVLPLGMLSGLSAAITIPALLIFVLAKLYPYWQIQYKTLKLEYIFITWISISATWSLNIQSSMKLCIIILILMTICFIINNNIQHLHHDNRSLHDKSIKILYYSILLAVILFLIEYYSHGIIVRTFRAYIQPTSDQNFYLYMLDRGCALLAVTSWVVIGMCTQRKHYLKSLLLYGIITYILGISDSLASLVGYFAAGITFIVTPYMSKRTHKVAQSLLLLSIILMPYAINQINPNYFAKNYEVLPDSAKHRLFIWHFVSKKIFEKPITGWGIGSAKNIANPNQDVVLYKHYKWSLLPLHPHNSFLHICLETGIIGLALILLVIYKWLNAITTITFASRCKYFCATAYASFVNYLIIGMISYSVWQLWWVCCGIWLSILVNYIFYPELGSYYFTHSHKSILNKPK